MNIPQIPTDNLYKFQAIVGVVIALTSLGFSVSMVSELELYVADLETSQVRLRLHIDQVTEAMENIRSHPPANEKELKLTREKANDNEEELAVLKGEIKKASIRVDNGRIVASLCGMLSLIGFVIASKGFAAWRLKVQIPQDKLLQLQVEQAVNFQKNEIKHLRYKR